MSVDRVLELIDAELARLDQRDDLWPAASRLAIQRRAWMTGVYDSRAVAAEKLREIRAAYIADELTREAEAMGLYVRPGSDDKEVDDG